MLINEKVYLVAKHVPSGEKRATMRYDFFKVATTHYFRTSIEKKTLNPNVKHRKKIYVTLTMKKSRNKFRGAHTHTHTHALHFENGYNPVRQNAVGAPV